MGSIIFTIILVVVAIGLIAFAVAARKRDYIGAFWGTLIAGILALIAAGAIIFSATYFQNSQGEAKVIVNSLDRTYQGKITEPSNGLKSPFEEFVPFDTFAQQVTFAGEGTGPSYAGGDIQGQQITVNVGGVNGGSTRANIDLVASYSITPDKIEDIYKEFRTQERFTQQIVQKQILSVARQIPAQYTAVDFRGTKRGEAELAITDALNKSLEKYGVEFSPITLQDIRYPENVENALNAIEEANQAAQKAEAEKRTSEVNAEKALIEAEGRAKAQIAEANGEAEANRVLSASLTPAVIQQRQTEALMKAAESGKLIVSGNSSPLLQVPTE